MKLTHPVSTRALIVSTRIVWFSRMCSSGSLDSAQPYDVMGSRIIGLPALGVFFLSRETRPNTGHDGLEQPGLQDLGYERKRMMGSSGQGRLCGNAEIRYGPCRVGRTWIGQGKGSGHF